MSHPRAIIHIDIDCFYAQVEMLQNPSLRSKPLGDDFVFNDEYLFRQPFFDFLGYENFIFKYIWATKKLSKLGWVG